jgi:hypothetical protein
MKRCEGGAQQTLFRITRVKGAEQLNLIGTGGPQL